MMEENGLEEELVVLMEEERMNSRFAFIVEALMEYPELKPRVKEWLETTNDV